MNKKLYKSESDRKIDGVCAGIAEYFDSDPTLVRVAFVLLTVVTGLFPGILGYIVLSIIIPKKSEVNKNGKKVS
jgi:phage shock protein C